MRSIDRLVRTDGAEEIVLYLVRTKQLDSDELYNIASQIEQERMEQTEIEAENAYHATLEAQKINGVTCERDEPLTESQQTEEVLKGRG